MAVVRIGLLGGSFNPPHLAHLALGRVARDTLALDELRWLPAGRPWQKPPGELAAAGHRAEMVRLLIRGEPRFVLDDTELRRPGDSFTIDTVRALEAAHPRAMIYLVIGQDQYARFDTWHEWRELLSRVTLAVAARDGQTPRPSRELMHVWHRVRLLELPAMPISATDIRARAARREALAPMVGAAVAGYIDQHALYRANTGS
jgi:nicotinate-nucleotide adenylyltransferase